MYSLLLTHPHRKVIAEFLFKLTDRLKLDEKNSCTISFTAKELESIRQKAEAARPHAETGMIRNSLRHVVDAITKALEGFGDGWQHEVIFEGAEKDGRYPVCVEGEPACPPEYVGGFWGYAEFLEALADPKHEPHEDFVEWAGDFDPEKFDAGKATKTMRLGLPDGRQFT